MIARVVVIVVIVVKEDLKKKREIMSRQRINALYVGIMVTGLQTAPKEMDKVCPAEDASNAETKVILLENVITTAEDHLHIQEADPDLEVILVQDQDPVHILAQDLDPDLVHTKKAKEEDPAPSLIHDPDHAQEVNQKDVNIRAGQDLTPSERGK
jgi:hypothetical protein